METSKSAPLTLNRRQVLTGTSALAALQAFPIAASAGSQAYQLKAFAAPYKIDPMRAGEAATWTYGGKVLST